MCGINGISWGDTSLVQRMNELIKHRGPDDEGIFTDGKITLGHRRLAILDLTARGHQPMIYEHNDKKIVIVFNGEIYNFQILRKKLQRKGYKFTSNTDTEVIPAAYLEWGEECIKRFNGMWAFAVYDISKQTIFLSRDRLGIKPLFYFYDGKRFAFSSEIKALLPLLKKRKINEHAVMDFLEFGLLNHNEETFFKGIKQLLPGHNMLFDLQTKQLQIKKYWEWGVSENLKPTAEELRKLFLDAVKLRMISDVPTGSSLSGGIDSSSIVSAMRKLAPETEIKTYSLSFEGMGFELDESHYQKIVSERNSTIHYVVSLTTEKILANIEKALWHFEQPLLSFSFMGQWEVMKLASSKGQKVLLDGQTADEILAGYDPFYVFYFIEKIRKGEFKQALRLLKYLWHYKKGLVKDAFFYLLLSTPFVYLWALLRKYFRRKKWLKNHLSINEIVRFYKEYTKKNLNEALLWNLKYRLPHLLMYEDKASMAHSIETRLPFADYRLVNLMLNSPADIKICPDTFLRKCLFRKAMRGISPDEILNRTDKIGFATPQYHLLKPLLDRIQKDIENAPIDKFVDKKRVKELLAKMEKKKHLTSEIVKIWTLALFIKVFDLEV